MSFGIKMKFGVIWNTLKEDDKTFAITPVIGIVTKKFLHPFDGNVRWTFVQFHFLCFSCYIQF